MKRSSGGKAYYMISAVAQKYNIHPQTLRLYEREGLLKPSRTEGNTRLYSEEDLEQLETILSLTRDLGVNLAGVEIILNMRRKMEQMQGEVNQFMEYVKHELARGLGDWEQRLSTALVKSSPTDLVRAAPRPRSKTADRQTTRRARSRSQTCEATNIMPDLAGRERHGCGCLVAVAVATLRAVPDGLRALRRHRLESRRTQTVSGASCAATAGVRG